MSRFNRIFCISAAGSYRYYEAQLASNVINTINADTIGVYVECITDTKEDLLLLDTISAYDIIVSVCNNDRGVEYVVTPNLVTDMSTAHDIYNEMTKIFGNDHSIMIFKKLNEKEIKEWL